MVLPSLSYSSGDRVTTEKVLVAVGCLIGAEQEWAHAQGKDKEEEGISGGRGGGRSCTGPEQGHGPSENPLQYQYHHRWCQDV